MKTEQIGRQIKIFKEELELSWEKFSCRHNYFFHTRVRHKKSAYIRDDLEPVDWVILTVKCRECGKYKQIEYLDNPELNE